MTVNTLMVGKKPLLCDISEIQPNLFVSGFGCVTENKLRKLGITHVVDVTNIPHNPELAGIEYLYVRVDDSPLANISAYFQPVAEFVEKAQSKGGKAIIYCAAGVSRSPSFCMMCLVLNEGLTLREAYYRINEQRPIISPNIAFWRQMIEFESQIRSGQTTVKLLSGMARPQPDVYLARVTK